MKSYGNLKSSMALVAACCGCTSALGATVWDWNDGTTQGWPGSAPGTVVNGQYVGTNGGNGSLQMFSPLVAASALADRVVVDFDLNLLSYSSATSPAQLMANIGLCAPVAVPDGCSTVNLPIQTATFGVLSHYSLLIGDVSRVTAIGGAAFLSILVTRNFGFNTSSLAIDNVVITTAPVPEAPVWLMWATGLLGLNIGLAATKRRGRTT